VLDADGLDDRRRPGGPTQRLSQRVTARAGSGSVPARRHAGRPDVWSCPRVAMPVVTAVGADRPRPSASPILPGPRSVRVDGCAPRWTDGRGVRARADALVSTAAWPGLDDFGDDWFRAARRAVAALRDETGLNGREPSARTPNSSSPRQPAADRGPRPSRAGDRRTPVAADRYRGSAHGYHAPAQPARGRSALRHLPYWEASSRCRRQDEAAVAAGRPTRAARTHGVALAFIGRRCRTSSGCTNDRRPAHEESNSSPST
jgi:hypothetical protein